MRKQFTHTVPARTARPMRCARAGVPGVDDPRRVRSACRWRAPPPGPRPRTSAVSAPGRRPRSGRSRSRSSAARSASARTTARLLSRRGRRAALDRLPSGPVRRSRVHPSEVIGVDHRRDRGLRRPTVARHVLVGVREHPLQEGRRGPTPRPAAACPPDTPARHRRTGRRPLRAAASRSASANTMSGLLPPSSAVKGTMLRAAAAPMSRAASGEPVKEIRRTRGSETSAAPTSSPMPCTTLNTPGREPRLVDQVREHRGGHRRPLRRLEDDGVAGGEGRGALPRREHERRIPGRDDHRGTGRHPLDGVRRCRWSSRTVPRIRRQGPRRRGSSGRLWGITRSSRLSWSIAMSRHSRRARGATWASIRSASRCRQAARSAMPAADQAGNACGGSGDGLFRGCSRRRGRSRRASTTSRAASGPRT